MTSFLVQLRRARPITAPRLIRRIAVDRRQAAATALVGSAQALLACGYVLLVALLWSAAAATAP
jgi:hypothetical protein